MKIEVINDNETGEILNSEQEAANPQELGKTGKEVKIVQSGFVSGDDDDDD